MEKYQANRNISVNSQTSSSVQQTASNESFNSTQTKESKSDQKQDSFLEQSSDSREQRIDTEGNEPLSEKEQIQKSTEKAVDIAGEVALDYFTGGKGSQIKNSLEQVPIVGDKVKKTWDSAVTTVAKGVSKNPLTGRLLKKADDMGITDAAGQAKDMMDFSNGSTGGGKLPDNKASNAANTTKSLPDNNSQKKDINNNTNKNSVFNSNNNSFLTDNIIKPGGINKKYIVIIAVIVSFFLVAIISAASGKDQNAIGATNESTMTQNPVDDDSYGDSDYDPSVPEYPNSDSSNPGGSDDTDSSNNPDSDSSNPGGSDDTDSSNNPDSNSATPTKITVNSNNISGKGGRKLKIGEDLLSLLGQEKIDNWNNKIKNDVSNASNMNQAVALAGYNLIQGALDEGIILPYFWGGGPSPNSIGVDSSMGSSRKIEYGKSDAQKFGSYWPWGYDCGGFVSWAIMNGGCSSFTRKNTTGFRDLPGKVNITADKAKAGDIAVSSTHVVLILNNTGSIIQVAEAKGTNYGMIFKEYNYSYFSSYEFIDMSVYYANYC